MTLREQEFYDRLAVFFDVMTDWKARLGYEMPFLQAQLAPAGKRVLDAACGTGWHSIALAQAGYVVTGADISPAMIAGAQANARNQGAKVAFKTAAFQDLAATAGTGFDAVICLGNSLVHVLGEDDLRRSLKAMSACLRRGGLLILHNLNYDKRMVQKPRWFQTSSGFMDGQETLVWRFADYAEDMVTFNIAVFQKGSDEQWAVQVQSTPQRPWQSGDLISFLGEAGFADIVLYGNLAGEPYTASAAGDLVIVAHKL